MYNTFINIGWFKLNCIIFDLLYKVYKNNNNNIIENRVLYIYLYKLKNGKCNQINLYDHIMIIWQKDSVYIGEEYIDEIIVRQLIIIFVYHI